MRRRLRYFRLFGLMTIVLAIVVGIYFGAKKRGEEIQPKTETEPIPKVTPRIVVAATDLMPRTLITPELLEEREVPFAPEGVFNRKDELVHRLTTALIRKGEPIFKQHVTPPLKEISAAYLIPPGQVGMALTISRPEILPPVRVGDYISVHAVFAGMKVRTIVPRTMILAVNNKVGEISLTSQPRPASPQQQQPQQTPSSEKKMILFVALSPQEAKSVALAMDSGATFYYTLHSAPLPPLLPPGLERDLTLQEIVGSPQVAAVIAKKQHGELPQIQPERAQESHKPSLLPVTLESITAQTTAQISRLDRSVQSLHQRMQKLEQQRLVQPLPPQDTLAKERRVVGVVGDQIVTFMLPQQHRVDGGERR